MNDYQKHRFTQRMLDSMFNTVSNKHVAILGYAFKKDTSDIRESAAIYVCRDLLEEQANLSIYDPKVPAAEIYDSLGVSEGNRGRVCDDAYAAADGAHAVAILTEWIQFRDLDYERIYAKMPKPAFLFDGRNLLDLTALRAIGFEASAAGRDVAGFTRAQVNEPGNGACGKRFVDPLLELAERTHALVGS